LTNIISIQILFNKINDTSFIKAACAESLEINIALINTVIIKKKSIDARNKNIKYNLTIEVIYNEEFYKLPIAFQKNKKYKNVEDKCSVVIVGAGPAGLFAALKLLQLGIKPIVIERGKNVQERRRDLAAINKQQIVNPESNYCFGEGGAGTYSDGKLYTRSNKRGDILDVLETFVEHGADENILVEAHPHIGTNKLPKIIENIRATIIEHGGEILFNTKLIDIALEGKKLVEIVTLNLTTNVVGTKNVENIILATGHSARDIYELLQVKNIALESKPFALGVRVEHPQNLIDKIQYHCNNDEEVVEKRNFLPPASYSWVHQTGGRGVYSFCMCPGGIIAPCATSQQEIVTNGWSPSKRNNPFSNSGIVVGLTENDYQQFSNRGALAGLQFQKEIEYNAWLAGGKTQQAPAQRLMDFINKKDSANLPFCSYLPGVIPYNISEIFPDFISIALRNAFIMQGNKMRNYLSNEAIVVATESRTSTPVRIPRENDTLCHTQITNLFPCGEGAGYAGGIMSAAMDGIKVAVAIGLKCNIN